MNMKFNFYLFLALIAFSACKTAKQPVRPMEQYQKDEISHRNSILSIPLKIDVKELESSINKNLPDPLYKDDRITDGDNMRVTAIKKEDIRIGVDSQMITYRVPLSLDIDYDLGLTTVNATADIALNFKTGFNIKENWELQTATTLSNYEWLKPPKVKLGGISLPVGFIGNIIVDRSREVFSQSIDEQVKTNFDFKKNIEETWKMLFDPMEVSPEYKAWLSVNPLDIGMTKIDLREDTIQSVIIIESQPRISIGEKPAASSWRPLPLFKYRNLNTDEFSMVLSTEISYEEAEKIAKDQLLGETYSYGKRSVTVEDLELYGQGERLVVNTKLSGSYNGSIFLTGKPVFNAKKNNVQIKDLKYTLDTKNFLVKSAGWLLKSTIKNQIQDNLDFLLNYNMEEIEKQIQQQLSDYKISEGIALKGRLDGISIENAYLLPQGMRIYLALNGELGVTVNGFN